MKDFDDIVNAWRGGVIVNSKVRVETDLRNMIRSLRTLHEQLQAENKQLRGEEPIPFAWWAECPKLAQVVMERVIGRNKQLREDLIEYGRHQPGCSEKFAAEHGCRCGWDKVKEALHNESIQPTT
jgi:hypothetical protein